jgi:hypothetical protein
MLTKAVPVPRRVTAFVFLETPMARAGWQLRMLTTLIRLACAAPSVAHAATYFVTPTAPAHAAGRTDQPFRTIASAIAQAQPGDTVVVTPGIYREAIVIQRAGRANGVITIRGLSGAVLQSPDANRSYSAFDFSSRAGYVRVQGFELTGGFAETIFVRAGAHDIELSGLTIHDNKTGIWVAGAARVTIRDTVLHHNFRTGVRIFAGAHDVQIINTRSEANDDGGGCDGESDGFNVDTGCSNIVFDNASAIGNSQDGFDLQGSNVTMLRATSRGNQCSGVKVSDSAYIENAVIDGNRTGLNVTGPVGAQTTIAFSTVVNNDLGVRAIGGGYTLALTDSVVNGPGKALDFAPGVTLFEARNIFARPNLHERLIVQETAPTVTVFSGDDVNRGTWTRASGQGHGTVAGDPRLEARTYTPAATSPALNSAQAAASVTVDHDGNPRPAGGKFDRGAIERQSVTPQLRIRTAAVRSGTDGCGPAQLRADLQLPGPFNPRTDALAISMSGAQGEVATLAFAPGQLRMSAETPGAYRGLMRRADGAVLRVSLRQQTGGYAVRLSGRDLDTWRAPDGTLTLDVTAGAYRVCSTTALHGSAGHFAMP